MNKVIRGALVIACTIGALLDVFLTAIGMSCGHGEGNPIMAMTMGVIGVEGALLFSFALRATLFLVIDYLGTKAEYMRVFATIMLIFVIMTQFFVSGGWFRVVGQCLK